MNAYELANYCDARETRYTALNEAANMLRQQADRIAELEKELNHMRSFFGCDPAYYGMTSAEPVAWAYESKNVDGKPYLSDVALKPLFGLVTRYGYKEIPLYTTPQHASDVKQIKELSDEEILNVALNERIRTNDIEDDWGNVVLEFAKAILKKASEK